VISLTGLGL